MTSFFAWFYRLQFKTAAAAGKSFSLIRTAVLIGLCLGLVGCQNNGTPVDLLSAIGMVEPTGTFTPFQALPYTPTPSPSPTATLTLIPTLTLTPTATLTPTEVPCMETQGRIERQEVTITPGAADLAFRIYFPPCYGQHKDYRYPVLYILHGQTYNDDQWDRLGMDEAADELIASGEAPPFLIVMPLEANTLVDPFENMFGYRVTDELVPWIDQNYPTCAERECRAIGGLSRGGAWAIHVGFDRYHMFGSVGGHSTPPFLSEPYRIPGWAQNIPADLLPRLYLDTGDTDWYINMMREFEALLTRYEIPHEWTLFEGTHNEEYWSAHVRDYLLWYTEPWKERYPTRP